MHAAEPNVFADRVQDGLAGRASPPFSPLDELAGAEEGFDALTRPPEISLFGEEGWQDDARPSPLFGLDGYLRVRLSFGRTPSGARS